MALSVLHPIYCTANKFSALPTNLVHQQMHIAYKYTNAFVYTLYEDITLKLEFVWKSYAFNLVLHWLKIALRHFQLTVIGLDVISMLED